jgi:hypothetical protein
MPVVGDRFRHQQHRTGPGLVVQPLCRLIQRIASALLLAGVCAGAGSSGAAPHTGPDRPFTVEWRVIAQPAPHLRAAAFSPGTKNATVVGDGGTVLRTDDGGKSYSAAPSALLALLRQGRG